MIRSALRDRLCVLVMYLTHSNIFLSCRANAVFVSALYLIHQTNMIMVTVKSKCEWWELQCGNGSRICCTLINILLNWSQIYICVIPWLFLIMKCSIEINSCITVEICCKVASILPGAWSSYLLFSMYCTKVWFILIRF